MSNGGTNRAFGHTAESVKTFPLSSFKIYLPVLHVAVRSFGPSNDLWDVFSCPRAGSKLETGPRTALVEKGAIEEAGKIKFLTILSACMCQSNFNKL